MRIHIIGTAGSGKTTLARQLASRLDIPHIELDRLYWKNNWTHSPLYLFHAQVQQVLIQESWIVEGEYEELNSLIWPKADVIIWLDYPLPIVLWRLLWRNLRYALTQQTLWDSNNRETIQQLFGRRSIVHRAYRSHYQRHAHYTTTFRHPALQPIRRFHLKHCSPFLRSNKSETNNLIANLPIL